MACSRAYSSYLGTVILIQSPSTREGMPATLDNLNASLPLKLSRQPGSKGEQTPDA